MKPVAFDYACPTTLSEAIALLARSPGAKLLAGGQTLGPMLNLRLVQPERLIDITRIRELLRVEDGRDGILLGACVTHAAVEDRRIPDATNGFLPRVARGIAYRAVRSRGTLGGSLAYADPAADWLACFVAMDAEIIVASPRGERRVRLAEFMRGALDCDLAFDEILSAIRLPKLTPGARAGYHKICRKTGEFAEAIGVFLHDPDRGISRFVSGATSSRPIVIDGSDLLGSSARMRPAPSAFDTEAAMGCLARAGLGHDPYELRIHAVALRRAFQDAMAPW